ncbi:MAG: Bug family tripartite tricarboxylate transporter substrate binding protein [Syntrophales bacterium]
MLRVDKGIFRSLASIAVALLLVGWASPAASQPKYPTRAIEIIVPFTAGGGVDLTARTTASYMSKKWGVPVNVVNKPGGNTIPATLEVYRADPDGYTLYEEASTVCYLAARKLPFDIMERTFIAITNIGPQVMYVPSSSPYKSLKELAVAAKEKPENFSWASRGGPDPADYQVIKFLKEAGVDYKKTRPVMSQGASQGVTLVAGGHAMLGSGSGTSALPALKAGTIRAVAVSGKERFVELPNVPTAAEAGYPTATVDNWFGIIGPPKLPAYVVDIWDKALQEMLKDPEIIGKLRNIWQVPFYRNSQEMREMVTASTAEVKKLWTSP